MRSALLILIDGLRPDALCAADAPTLRRLRAEGASTMAARTVIPSMSLPCHASLFYGVEPGRHGITSNAWHPMARPVPSLVDVVHAAGRKAAMFYNWEPLRDLAAPGSVDESHMIRYDGAGGDSSDRRLFALAREWIERTPDFGFAFLYYGWADIVGHEHRWMSPQYMDAIAGADRLVAGVLPALPPECLLVVTADHGGHETHGTDCHEDMTIPLILRGRGIAARSTIGGDVRITDIAPTIAKWLGIEKPREWVGRELI
jgi:predicted AlkP superfamily pyrophosphatase or phosphodiesterase